MEYLFVYGTLLKDFNAGVLRPLQVCLELKGYGSVNGELYDLGQYPGLVEAANAAATVKGEVYRVKDPEKVFAVLDEYEGLEYSRRQLPVKLDTDENIGCWVYVYIQELSAQHVKIFNGDYLAYIRDKG